MTDFIESLNRYREERQSIYALLNDIDRIVEGNKENPMSLLAELSQENAKKPLPPKDIKYIKNWIVTTAKLQKDNEIESTRLDDTVEINQSDSTIEIDNNDEDNTENANDPEAEDIIEHPVTRRRLKALSNALANKDISDVDDALLRQADTDRTKLEGQILNGRYTLEKCIGSGGMGTVYRATDLNRVESGIRTSYVAVKILRHSVDSSQIWFQNLRQEVNRFQKFNHPCIVDIHEINLDHNIAYLVMEYLSGKTLREKLHAADFEGLPLQEALPIIRGHE